MIMRRILLLTFLLIFKSASSYAQDFKFGDFSSEQESHFAGPRFEVGYSTGKFIGIDRDYAEFGVFLPLSTAGEWVPFLDARGYRFEDSQWGSSAGIGLRAPLNDGSIFGVNAYYDYLEGDFNHGFHRGGAGFEWLGSCLDVRMNGYFPFSSRIHHSKPRVCTYPGGYILECRRNEFRVGDGFDAEVGLPLLNFCDFTIYGAMGPYYYHFPRHQNFWGGQWRLEINWRSYLSVRVNTSYDGRYHSRTQVQALVSVPLTVLFGNSSLTDYCNDLITQPVRRNGIIFTDRCCFCTQNW